MAQRDGWKSRQRDKGKGLEYSLRSLPQVTQIYLLAQEVNSQPAVTPHSSAMAISNLGKSAGALAREIEAARQERDALLAAPLRNSDTEAAILAYLARGREAGLFYMNALVERVRSHPEKGPETWAQHPTGLDAESLIRMLSAMIGPELETGIQRYMRALPEPEGAGPPLVERIKKLESLDSRIEKAEKQLAELRDEANRAGVRLDAGKGGIY